MGDEHGRTRARSWWRGDRETGLPDPGRAWAAYRIRRGGLVRGRAPVTDPGRCDASFAPGPSARAPPDSHGRQAEAPSTGVARPGGDCFEGPWATWAPGRRKVPGWCRLPEHAFEVLDLPLKLTNTPRILLGAEAGAFLPFLVEHLLQFRALCIPRHIRLPGARSTARPHAERTRAGCQAVLRHGRPGVGYAAP